MVSIFKKLFSKEESIEKVELIKANINLEEIYCNNYEIRKVLTEIRDLLKEQKEKEEKNEKEQEKFNKQHENILNEWFYGNEEGEK